MVSKATTLLSIIFARIVYVLSFLMPRANDLWVFVGWHRNKEREVFADNSKYFFLYVTEHRKDIRSIWLARDVKLAEILNERGYEAYSIHSLRGIYFALRAGYTIIDAFLERDYWRYTGKSKIIQLWHGKGMKKTGHDSDYSLKTRSRFTQANLFAPLYRLVASSQHTAKLMSSTFNEPSGKILVHGLPRNDVLLKDIQGADIDAHFGLKEQVEKAKTNGAKKIIMYAPTFRPDGSNPLQTLDFNALEKTLGQNNYHLIFSLHPKFARKDYIYTNYHSHMSYIGPGYDVYPFLKFIDVLITDYSSLYIDFLLLDKPVIFYTYDLLKYKNEMGLHEDFDTLTPGPHPQNQDDLLNSLVAEDTYAEKREEVRNILFEHNDGNASARSMNAILHDMNVS